MKQLKLLSMLCLFGVTAGCSALLGLDFEKPVEVDVDGGQRPDASDAANADGGARNPAPIAAVSMGRDHNCALTRAGAIWCWGSNVYGQLGRGAGDGNGSTPQQVLGLGTNGVGIMLGSNRSCASKADNSVWCWGDNIDGVLLPTLSKEAIVQPTAATDIKQAPKSMVIGNSVICALYADNSVWCWGRGKGLGLGDGNASGVSKPTQVSGMTSVSALRGNESGTVCALKSDRTLWCWGDSSSGQAGIDTFADVSSPRRITGLSDVIEFDVGGTHACAVKSDNTVWCWGSNKDGRLGRGDSSTQIFTTPQRVVDVTLANTVRADDDASCALRSDGTVWCWGANPSSTLATTDTLPAVLRPSQVPGLNNVEQLEMRDERRCACRADDKLLCWGKNDIGVANGQTQLSVPAVVTGIVQ